jgi:hypothetical protein
MSRRTRRNREGAGCYRYSIVNISVEMKESPVPGDIMVNGLTQRRSLQLQCKDPARLRQCSTTHVEQCKGTLASFVDGGCGA